jgi:hypothetical protein
LPSGCTASAAAATASTASPARNLCFMEPSQLM